MTHYYTVLAAVLAPALLVTAGLGMFHDGSQRHLALGLLTSVLAVATNTIFILFMIVTGRVLRQAIRARRLAPEFLEELNAFFARKPGYPLALVAAFAAVAAAVLGYGSFIGVPPAVHMLVGTLAVFLNLYTIPVSLRTLRGNQVLLDRATLELDRLDRSLGPVPEEEGAVDWRYGPGTRWLVFAVSAWFPYLYWGAVVWRGEFETISPVFPVGTALVSLYGFHRAWRSHHSGSASR